MRYITVTMAAMLAGISVSPMARAADPQTPPLLLSLAPSTADSGDSQTVLAQSSVPATADGSQAAPTVNIPGYFTNWFDRVRQAQASQPHWMTPLVTVTPRLEQEVRYDQYWQNLGNGAAVDTFGSGKGLELIPTTTNEILINPPAYQERYVKKPVSGWADDQFLVVKQRLLSANEENGNYIVSAFLGVTATTGSQVFTQRSWFITPTIAGGKGWGDFDVQATFSMIVPLAYQNIIGTAASTNISFQYHFLEYFWPELEVNYTYWLNGLRAGKNQVFLTPGMILGRFQIYDRAKLILGAGYQFAVSPTQTYEPVLTPIYNRAWLVTARIAF
ncbi:MAG TPA: hypothetical protein PLD10_15625 [Rhodopila sp.]|nr:hypothetical protein [Rhodopila sp.]